MVLLNSTHALLNAADSRRQSMRVEWISISTIWKDEDNVMGSSVYRILNDKEYIGTTAVISFRSWR